jgi:hypothetical protein
MLGLRPRRSATEVLVSRVESALGTCTTVSVLRDGPDEVDALDAVVSDLAEQADLLGGSDDPSDQADVAEIEAVSALVTARKLELQGIDPRAVRRRALSELAHVGLAPAPDRVPLLHRAYAGRRRTAEDAVDRVRALIGVLHAAHGADGREVGMSLHRRDLVPWLTPGEKQVLGLLARHGSSAPELAEHRAWVGRRVEGLHALGWALGLLPDLRPVGFSDVHPDAFVPVGPALTAGDPAEGVALRAPAELVARLDVLTCAHRAVQEHQVGGARGPLPRDVVPAAIAERRVALQWLLSRDGWDAIEADTDGHVRVGD